MITVKVLEPDEQCSYREIDYRDQNGKLIHFILVDEDNRIFKSYLYEHREDGKTNSIALFGPDHITPLGVKEFHYDHLGRRSETIEYEISNGEKIQLNKLKFYCEGDTERCYKTVTYGRTEEPVYYTLYTYDEAGIAPIGTYNMNDEAVRKLEIDKEIERIF